MPITRQFHIKPWPTLMYPTNNPIDGYVTCLSEVFAGIINLILCSVIFSQVGSVPLRDVPFKQYTPDESR